MNLLELHGFEVVSEEMHLAIPKRIPVVSPVVNFVMSRIPGVRLLSSTQLVVARKLPIGRREYSVSLVVPCHNERANIARCLDAVRPFGAATEVVVVDDGSTDGTADAARAAAAMTPVDVRVISHAPRRGKGHAVAAGFDAARGDIVVIVDADVTTDPADLQPLYEAFATGRAEFVNGTRFVYPMESRAMGWANYMGNRLFTILFSWIIGRRVSDTLCGTKAMFRRDAAWMPRGRDPWGDYDWLFGAAQLRLTIRELPVHYRERIAGRSKMQPLAHAWRLLTLCWVGFWQVRHLRPLGGDRPSR
jgi:glycosyltransferase involved in cell wall biosynthesis